MTRLCERPDFPELLSLVAGNLDVNAAIVEKDYYVTEALRIIAGSFGDLVLFKGGTSLSKGWKLIERFSEDIDLYVQEDTTSGRATERRLKAIAGAVAAHPALRRNEGKKRGGTHSRVEFYEYEARLGATPGLGAEVMLEAGVQSGDYPVEERLIQSLLGEALDHAQEASGAEDQTSFTMRLLHFRRTFVEKLFTIHDRVERQVKGQGESLGSAARHYYDIHCLLQRDEVVAMLRSEEYADIARDYRRLSSLYFPNQALPPRMELRNSSALFPGTALRQELQHCYQEQCGRLCYRTPPLFTAVLEGLEGVRELLIPATDAIE